jgi:hypothetical protein
MRREYAQSPSVYRFELTTTAPVRVQLRYAVIGVAIN